MQPIGIFLILLSVGAFAAPVSGVIILNADDLSGVLVPDGLEEIVSEMTSEDAIELPEYVSSSYDRESRSAQVIFSFTNSFEFDLSLNMLIADIICLDHDVFLGHAALMEQVDILPGETEEFAVVFAWTADAEEHFLEEHLGESVVDVKLVDMDIDVSGITVEVPEEVLLALPIGEVM